MKYSFLVLSMIAFACSKPQEPANGVNSSEPIKTARFHIYASDIVNGKQLVTGLDQVDLRITYANNKGNKLLREFDSAAHIINYDTSFVMKSGDAIAFMAFATCKGSNYNIPKDSLVINVALSSGQNYTYKNPAYSGLANLTVTMP